MRSEAKATKWLTPLVTPLIDFGTEDVAKLQSEGDTLQRALGLATQGNDSTYQTDRVFLYRVKQDRQGQESKQLALQRGLRHWVMTLAHAGTNYRQFLVARHDQRCARFATLATSVRGQSARAVYRRYLLERCR